MHHATVSQSASQGSAGALDKGPQQSNAKTKVQLKGKTLAEQDALLKPEEPKKDGHKRDKGGGHGGRDKGASAKTKPTPYPPDVQKVLERWPDGVAMTFYADYKEGTKAHANGEFQKRATEQSKAIGAVRMVGGKLEIGKTHAMQHASMMIEEANAVSSYLAGILSPTDLALDRHKLAQLHIYSHGWGSGMGTGAHRNKGEEGNLSIGKLDKFVAAISGSLRTDVNVALFACSTGKDMDKKGKKDIDEVDDPTAKKHKGKKPREHGEGSFADAFRDKLEDAGHTGANVGAHMTAGHMSGNPEGRYFSGDGGPAETFFDTIFPAEFRAKEAERFKMKEKKFSQKLKKWFIRYTVFWRKLKGKKGKQMKKTHDKVDMGYVMMVDPAQAKKIFREAWDAAGGDFANVSWVPDVDYSKLGVGGGDAAKEARAPEQENIIDL